MPGSRVAGLRTFGLLGFAGGLAAVLARHGAGLIGIVLVAGAAVAMVVGYARDRATDGEVSATTIVAGISTIGCTGRRYCGAACKRGPVSILMRLAG